MKLSKYITLSGLITTTVINIVTILAVFGIPFIDVAKLLTVNITLNTTITNVLAVKTKLTEKE